MPSDDVHVYWLIATPPVAGAVQDTLSVVVPAEFVPADGVGLDTVGDAGAFGTVVTRTVPGGAEASLEPDSFVATTVTVVFMLLPKPSMVRVVPAPVAVCVVP